MVEHTFICDNCQISVRDSDTKIIHKCLKCGREMRWDLCAKSHGAYNFVSQSLAINPSQIEEHKKLYPNVDVLPDGRIHLTSVRQHDGYIDKRGFVKFPQRLKIKGKRIS